MGSSVTRSSTVPIFTTPAPAEELRFLLSPSKPEDLGAAVGGKDPPGAFREYRRLLFLYQIREGVPITREQLPRVTRRTTLPANRTLRQGQVRLLPALACRKCPALVRHDEADQVNRSQRHHHVWYATKALDDAYRNYRGDLNDLARAAED